ncbi:hypothetical protein WA026_002002 [Henosepilachna vigintioctopunctata]|uniref:Uncharacterized protein n=1 Tax=Henosepilachna vigintioctopunctata TaxID=420089 RepID=A0AAW1UTI4_9CUCU
MNFSVVILCASLLAVCSAINLPTYSKPCEKNDPKYSKCAVDRGNEILSSIAKGDVGFGLPVMDPLKNDEFQHFQHPNINVTITEIVLHGLTKGKLLSYVRTDESLDSELFTEHLQVICNYSLSGILLEHNINGTGKAEMELYNVSIPIHVALTKSDRAEYVSVRDVIVKVNPGKVTFNTTHFNGDLKTLKLAEKSANANWKKMMGILSPILDKLLTTTVRKGADAFFKNIPHNLIFG